MSSHPDSLARRVVPGPQAHPLQISGAEDVCGTLAQLAVLGGLVAGSTAAATHLRRVSAGELQTGPALAATARSAVTGAAATAVAGALAGAVARQGFLRLGLMLAVGTAVVYGLDQWRAPGRTGAMP